MRALTSCSNSTHFLIGIPLKASVKLAPLPLGTPCRRVLLHSAKAAMLLNSRCGDGGWAAGSLAAASRWAAEPGPAKFLLKESPTPAPAQPAPFPSCPPPPAPSQPHAANLILWLCRRELLGEAAGGAGGGGHRPRLRPRRPRPLRPRPVPPAQPGLLFTRSSPHWHQFTSQSFGDSKGQELSTSIVFLLPFLAVLTRK